MPGSSSKDSKKDLHELHQNREIGETHSYLQRYHDKSAQLRTGNPFKILLSSMLRALEAKTREISLPDDDPFMVRRMLDHAYMRLYPETKLPFCSPEKEEATYASKLSTHDQMFAMGEKYGVEALKEEAAWKFQENLKALRLRSELPGMLEVVPAIYTTTPESDRGLRDHVVNICASGCKLIKTVPEFKAIALQVSEFSFAVLLKLGDRLEIKENEKPYGKPCARCSSKENWKIATVKYECGRWEEV